MLDMGMGRRTKKLNRISLKRRQGQKLAFSGPGDEVMLTLEEFCEMS